MLKLFKGLVPTILALIAWVPDSLAADTTLVYVSARNCGYCRGYEAQLENQIKALAKHHNTDYRVVSVASFANISDEQEYPADLKWIARSAHLTNLTPTFLLISGKKIIKTALGTEQLTAYIVPLIQ